MRRFAGADARRHVAIAVFTALFASGCDRLEHQIDAVATDGTVVGADSSVWPSKTRVDSVANTEDPFFVFGFSSRTDAAATNRRTTVWLHNRSLEPVVVEAEAGAGAVVLDTVAPSDSIQVRIETRADSVRFIAESLDGAAVGQIALPMASGPQKAAFPR